METITPDLLGYIVKVNNINFIALARTPWHATGVDSVVKYLQDYGVNVRGIVLICINEKGGYILNKSHFTNNKCKLYQFERKYMKPRIIDAITELKNIYSAPKILSNNESKEILHIASAWHISIEIGLLLCNSCPNKKIQFLKFEEGLATYFPFNRTLSNIWLNMQEKRITSRIISFLHRWINRDLILRCEKKLLYTNLNLLLENKMELSRNQTAIKYYRNTLLNKETQQKEEHDFSEFDNSIIICTLAYPKSDIQDNEDYKVLSKIINVLKMNKHKVILKPHPREIDYKERYANIDCTISCNHDIALENILKFANNIKAVISFSSTVLITTKLFYDITSISIINFINLKNCSGQVKGEMESFKTCFESIVQIPSSIDELLNIL